jgi:hypothetical protein
MEYRDLRRRVEWSTCTSLRVVMAQHAIIMIDFVAAPSNIALVHLGERLRENKQQRQRILSLLSKVATELDHRYEDVVAQMNVEFDNIAMNVASTGKTNAAFSQSECARFYEQLSNGRARNTVSKTCEYFNEYLHQLSLLQNSLGTESFPIRAWSCIMSASVLGVWLDRVT